MVDRKKTSEELFGELSACSGSPHVPLPNFVALLTDFANAVRAEAEHDLAGRADAAYLRALGQADENRKMHYFRQDASAALNGMLMGWGLSASNLSADELAKCAYTAFKAAKAMRDEAEKVAIEERVR